MGEFSSSDCTWKKMVLSKANNEWTSTIKTVEQNADIGAVTPGLEGIKTENEEEADIGQSYTSYYANEELMVQELDPLLAEVSQQPRRRRGSGPRAETAEERATRLAKMSAYAAQRLASETPEQRAMRLKRMSAYAAKRLAQETSEQRAARLARMSAYAARRLARETAEQRQLRLSRMSAYAARRQARKKFGSSGAPVDSTKSFDEPII